MKMKNQFLGHYLQKKLNLIQCFSNAKHYCTKCEIVCYCSTICQEKHWLRHKLVCFAKITKEELDICSELESPKNEVIEESTHNTFDGELKDQDDLITVIEIINKYILTNNKHLAMELLEKCKDMKFKVTRI